MLEGVMLLWFIQVAIATVFVAVDIRSTPEATVMKWGFVIITLFSGLFGALLYVLSCREPLPGTHELYVAAKWRQVVGSTMHCVAGRRHRHSRGCGNHVPLWSADVGGRALRICLGVPVRLVRFPGPVHEEHVRLVP